VTDLIRLIRNWIIELWIKFFPKRQSEGV
jgi:hypothetical protein